MSSKTVIGIKFHMLAIIKVPTFWLHNIRSTAETQPVCRRPELCLACSLK